MVAGIKNIRYRILGGEITGSLARIFQEFIFAAQLQTTCWMSVVLECITS